MKKLKKTTKKNSMFDMSKVKRAIRAQNRQTERENAKFEALSRPEKRVAIARDVLAQIRLKKLIPTYGYWLTGPDQDDLFTEKDIKNNSELQEVLGKTKECEGCALGGMFMCAVRAADKLKLGDLDGVKDFLSDQEEDPEAYPNRSAEHTVVQMSDTFRYLEKFFSRSQLEMIEAAFESNGGTFHDAAGREFAIDADEPTDRMRLIMENIVVNKGTFRPEKQPVQVWTTPGFVG